MIIMQQCSNSRRRRRRLAAASSVPLRPSCFVPSAKAAGQPRRQPAHRGRAAAGQQQLLGSRAGATPSMRPDGSEVKFGAKLAHTEKSIRDSTVKSLAAWLGARKQMSEIELMKVWKGLFYCMWMSDKVPVQQR